MLPIVSVIIPTFNRAHLIGETLESILNQTFQDWECIIVDDRSTDNSKQVIESYLNKDKRFKYYERPFDRRKGANACRNYGFELSKGKFIQWFDSDDLMNYDLLEAKLKEMEDNPDCDFCLSKMEAFEVKDRELVTIRTTRINYNNLFEDYVAGKITIGTPTVFWRKSILENQITLFDESLTQSQDLEFHSRFFFRNRKACIIDNALIKFRVSSKSISEDFLNDKSNHLASFLEVRKRISNLDSSNMVINNSVIKSVLSLMRNSLAARNYEQCERLMKFIFEINKNKNLLFLLKLYRLRLAFILFKLVGGGDTTFKRVLKL